VNNMIKDNLRILLVEDHPFQLRATQYLLESYGFGSVIQSYVARSSYLVTSKSDRICNAAYLR